MQQDMHATINGTAMFPVTRDWCAENVAEPADLELDGRRTRGRIGGINVGADVIASMVDHKQSK